MDKLLGYLAGALVLAVVLTSSCSRAHDQPNGGIVTEAQLRAIESMPWDEEVDRGEPSPGAPRILISVPESGAVVMAPVPVRVRFVAESDARIITESLRVRYGPFDVTEKVLEQLVVSQDGIDGRIEQAIPGRYRFRVSISDTQNRTGEADLRFRVVAGR